MGGLKSEKANAASAANENESAILLRCVSRLRKSEIVELLASHKLPVSGTKADCLSRVTAALADQTMAQADLVDVLDQIEPWDKQQVYLLAGPEGNLGVWQSLSSLRRRLAPYDCAQLLNCRKAVGLPKTLTLSNIEHTKNRLRISAVERREHTNRRPEQDKTARINNETFYYHAYSRLLTRGLVIFEWNLDSNTATLQISQLPSRASYQERVLAFTKLVAPWLDLNVFAPIDLSRAISTFHASENGKNAETRSQEIDYSVEGRRVSGRAATATDPLLGVAVVDKALQSFRKKGIGYSGNFYFTATDASSNPIPVKKEVHVHIQAEKDRVRFFTANTKENFSYVLQRIRSASQE